MLDRQFIEALYVREDYTLADAFRPQPGWGRRVKRVPAEDLAEFTDEAIVQAAKDAADTGYRLVRVEAIGGEPHIRVLHSVAHDKRMQAAQKGGAQ